MMLALVMALSLVACGEQGDSQKGDDSASGDKVVKIGVFEPTSGQNGGGGKKEILGIEYAHSLKPTVTINGEEYSVQLVYADNASDQAKAPTAAQTLISQGVSVVIGTYGSACAIAAGPLFESAKIPAIGTSCTNPQVTAGNDYYFRVGYIDPFQGAVMANFAFNEKGSSNCALIIESGDDYSAGFGNYFRQEMERLGGKATTLEFQKGEADFSTIMASIKSEGYDGIFAPVSIETAAMIISQARDAGITCPIMAGDTWDDISIAQRTGSKATDIYFSAFFDAADTTNEAGKAFVDGFTKWVAEDATRVENNGGVSDVISSVTPCGYDAYMAAVGAIEAAQSTDGTTIRDALATLEISGLITGDLKFDENGDAIKNYAVIKTIENGEIVYFSTFNGLE
ncbi:MAG: ABC transporter substrate-binding protein [Firmicutes bacterium]|nr:ABC transporter substrate-binding protein [Bacillota bacterium]